MKPSREHVGHDHRLGLLWGQGRGQEVVGELLVLRERVRLDERVGLLVPRIKWGLEVSLAGLLLNLPELRQKSSRRVGLWLLVREDLRGGDLVGPEDLRGLYLRDLRMGLRDLRIRGVKRLRRFLGIVQGRESMVGHEMDHQFIIGR